MIVRAALVRGLALRAVLVLLLGVLLVPGGAAERASAADGYSTSSAAPGAAGAAGEAAPGEDTGPAPALARRGPRSAKAGQIDQAGHVAAAGRPVPRTARGAEKTGSPWCPYAPEAAVLAAARTRYAVLRC
ncbi:hypothetical protein AA958_09275 [Streptomyces sp. CNQ-509]|uniref:hypothetical protein n=1 Tax=unclassified Streptomyces TaxID=2593676 RepID=UPI00062E04AF|nr:hypothetical protein [Streptomyces sp. CNQ-509]AKH82388.1 hypothetical protein AA958_09275 [Streptomyces sp. CNQ-509]